MYDMYPEWGPAAHDPEHPLNGSTNSASGSAQQRGPAGGA